MIIFTFCSDPERGKYTAFTYDEYDEVVCKKVSCTSAVEAVGELVCELVENGHSSEIEKVVEV